MRPAGFIALIDPDGERSFLTDRGANDALEADDIPDALIVQAALIHLSGYSFFAPSPRAAVPMRFGARERSRSASTRRRRNSCARPGRTIF